MPYPRLPPGMARVTEPPAAGVFLLTRRDAAPYTPRAFQPATRQGLREVPMRWFFGTLATLSCAALLAMVAGCGGSAGQASAPAYDDPHPLPLDTMTVATREIGVYGGRFVIGQTTPPKTFNAMMANETSSTDVTQRLFATLAEFDNTTETTNPTLAKSWEMSADGLTYTWRLRRGARFSDGHPITSADVLFSFEVAYDEEIHPSVQDLLLAGGKPFVVTAPDSYTVVMRIESPYALLVPAVGSLRIMPKHKLEAAYRSDDFPSTYAVSEHPDSIVTSGAWRVKEYVANEKTVLSRNPYWVGVDAKGQRLPYLDELVFLIVPDQNTAALKFQAGDLDGLDNVKAEDYLTFDEGQERGNYTLYDLGPALNTNFFWFNLNRVREPKPGKKLGDPYVDAVKYAWFSRKEFRQAVSMAIDRQAMINGPFYGEAVLNWSQMTEGNKTWYNPDLKPLDYNLEAAKAKLDAIGFIDRDGDGVREDTEGRPIQFSLKTNSDNLVRIALCNLIADDLTSIGIKATMTPVDFNTLITNLRQDFQYDAILLGLQAGVPPDPAMGQNVWRSSGLTHFWNVKQPRPETAEEAEIDRLIDVNIATSDMPARLAAWRRVEEILTEQCFIIWLPTLKAKIPVRNKFGNLEPSVIPHRIIWNIERVYVKPPGARA
jgi:peptide/nickel transport system substrate-binding protein